VYAPLVSDGQYLVVEDTFIDRYGCEEVVVDDKGRELEPRFAAGSSWQALEAWLPDHPRFTVDAARDRHLLSMNPGGWLRAAEVHPDEQPVATIRHTAPEP
jgi:cephalosporin hydroxylase